LPVSGELHAEGCVMLTATGGIANAARPAFSAGGAAYVRRGALWIAARGAG